MMEIIMEKRFLTPPEAMELLRISRPTLDRMISRGEIPSYRVGKRRVFDSDELIAWVKSNKDDRSIKSIKKKTENRKRK
jgi:excisionase family DNA binding protein